MRTLGDTAEIVVDRRSPANLRHVEIDRPRQAIRLIEATLQAIGGHAGTAIAVDFLEQRIDAEGHAVGEQRQPAGIVKQCEPVPQRLFVGRQIGVPGRMPIRDGLCRRTLLQIRRLAGKLDMAHAGFKASRRIGLIEGVDTELVQKRCHRDLRMASDGIAQRQRAMRGQFHHEPVGQRPDGIVVVLLVRSLPALRP